MNYAVLNKIVEQIVAVGICLNIGFANIILLLYYCVRIFIFQITTTFIDDAHGSFLIGVQRVSKPRIEAIGK